MPAGHVDGGGNSLGNARVLETSLREGNKIVETSLGPTAPHCYQNLGRGLRLPSKKLFKKVHVPKSQKHPKTSKTILSTYCIREGNFGSRGNSSVDVSPFS